MFMEAVARLSAVAGPHNEHVLAWEAQGQFVSVATEPVKGTGLDGVLAEAGTLAAQAAAALGAQAALGLAGLHEHGIVHGAVKPSTLIQTPEGIIVLIDAGLAQAQGGADLTETGAARQRRLREPRRGARPSAGAGLRRLQPRRGPLPAGHRAPAVRRPQRLRRRRRTTSARRSSRRAG